MDKIKFKEQMDRLEKQFNHKAHVEEYWIAFRFLENDKFEKICTHLIYNFQPKSYKRFPLMPDFLEVKKMFHKHEEEYTECKILPEERATPEDTRAFFAVLTEIGVWIDRKYAKYYDLYIPFQDGLLMHFTKPTFAQYCREYLQLLQDRRAAR